MRWLYGFLLLSVGGLVNGLSSAGNRLLVVQEDAADKAKYSQFWADLSGMASRWTRAYRKLRG